jgi:hypothetical protein
MASTPFLFALSYALSISLAIASEEYENPANAQADLRGIMIYRTAAVSPSLWLGSAI